MRKKLQLTKSLLVAACLLLGGTSAWATPTSIYERGTTNAWAAADLTDWTANTTNDYFTYEIDGGLKLENTSAKSSFKSSYFATKSIAPGTNSIVYLTASVTMGDASGRNTSYDYLKIGGVELQVNGQNKTAQFFVDGVAQGSTVGATRGGTYDIIISIDQATKVVTYSVTGGATIAEANANSDTKVESVVFGHNRGGSESYNSKVVLSKIDISEEAQSVTTANYTLKYVAGGSTIKTETLSGVVGADIALTAAQKANFTKDEITYIYESDDSEGKKVLANGSAVVTLTYHVAGNYTYTVNGKYGASGSKVLVSNSLLEGSSETYYYPKYILSGTTLYTKNNNSTNPYFGGSVTMGNANQTIDINYTDGNIENVVFYVEGEDIEGATASSSSNADIRCSKGKGGYFASDAVLTTLSAGVYKIVGQVWGGTGVTYTIKANDETLWSCDTKGYLYTEVATVTLTSTTNLVISAAGDNGKVLDYVYIEKIPANVSATIPASGFATVSSAYPLDCANLPSGVKAYKVSEISSTAVTLEQVTTAVAAGTGLILEGAAGTYNIPVVASGTDISAANKLKAAVTATAVAANAAYVLKDGKFCLVTSASSVPAGKAYLLASDVPASARELNIEFGGEATGVNGVRSQMEEGRGEVFDLQGRRIDQPTKGLYIVNGRKMIIK